MAKVHFCIVSKPIRSGGEVEALCRDRVRNAEAVPLEADAFIVGLGQTSSFCRSCLRAVVQRPRTRRKKYVYALVTGEERFHEEAA